MQESNKGKIIATIVVIAAVALIALAASMLGGEKQEIANQTQSSPSTTSSSETLAANTNKTYKDGTYTIEDSYISPGGEEDIKVTLKISGGTIVDADVEQHPDNRDSAEHQALFRESYKSRVVGKALGTLQLSRVSGASLTTASFNEALDKIRNQAEI